MPADICPGHAHGYASKIGGDQFTSCLLFFFKIKTNNGAPPSILADKEDAPFVPAMRVATQAM